MCETYVLQVHNKPKHQTYIAYVLDMYYMMWHISLCTASDVSLVT